jgi:hypothetical protein
VSVPASSRLPQSGGILAVLLLAGATPAAAGGPPGLPDLLADPAVAAANPLPDFSFAGFGFGSVPLPPSPARVIDVARFGATPDDDLDDSRAIMAALAAANAESGPVTLRFPAGRFILSDVLVIARSDIVVEGAGRGPGGTEIHILRPLTLVDRSARLDELRRYLVKEAKRQVEPKRNIDLPFSPYSWSGGFLWVQSPGSRPAVYLDDQQSAAPRSWKVSKATRGAFRLTLEKGSDLKAGDIVRLRWTSPDGPKSALVRELYGQTLQVGRRHWEDPTRPIVEQTTRVKAVDGTSVTLATPLMHDVRSGLPATLVRFEGLTNVGIRDLHVSFPAGPSFGHHLEEGWNAIAVEDVFDGFVTGVRISESDSAILTYNSASLTISDILTDGARTAHYAVHLGNVHNVLATGLDIHNPVRHSLSVNTQSTRSVFQRATVWKGSVLDQHAGANHQNLFDQIRVHVVARPGRDGAPPSYPLWDGSGADYWQPGHGRFNTHWNIQVVVEAGARPDQSVLLTGLDEGPDARIVGVWGNRSFAIDYRPTPYVEGLNERPVAVPSLYDWQLQRRLAGQPGR